MVLLTCHVKLLIAFISPCHAIPCFASCCMYFLILHCCLACVVYVCHFTLVPFLRHATCREGEASPATPAPKAPATSTASPETRCPPGATIAPNWQSSSCMACASAPPSSDWNYSEISSPLHAAAPKIEPGAGQASNFASTTPAAQSCQHGSSGRYGCSWIPDIACAS